MQYTTPDGTILVSNKDNPVTYTCDVTDIADGVYESYESSYVEDELCIIKIIRTVVNSSLTITIEELNAEEKQAFLEQIEEEIYNEPEEVFDKSTYARKVNELHESWFLGIITKEPYDYISYSELCIWLQSDEYADEARMFIDLWINSCELIKSHIETATSDDSMANLLTDLNTLFYGN
jgi:hypothetical protein